MTMESLMIVVQLAAAAAVTGPVSVSPLRASAV